MAEVVLGKKYDLSLVFVGEKRARRINQETRNKSYVPNVLSFPLDKNVGEIFICESAAAKEYRDFNLSQKGYIAYLFIHGCLHLKGMDHGAAMETKEQNLLKRFSIK